MRASIALDPGHGGNDPGARGPTGLCEADCTYAIAKACKEDLLEEKDLIQRVVLTREDLLKTVGLSDRTAIANEAQCTLFVSIHCNAAEDQRANGFEVFTTRGETDADLAATFIWASIRKAFPGLRGRADYDDGDADKERDFFVLRRTSMPAVLVECAFISNPSEEALLRSPRWREEMGLAIADGICSWAEDRGK